ncbi:hypothetical protein IHV09_19345 [Fictibacillus sp. 23RED33]|uniref:hypothetical protein n=1 Tax=Fictibacillus sp. 23RED33 TaxID=2745879 RepID=UPI0018CDD8C8|nr:hypothetical protein [Fictibacillus sp. 23RED33]MBH0175732.1 hypothetical protein [Fictibacillus sp. 23RED33]
MKKILLKTIVAVAILKIIVSMMIVAVTKKTILNITKATAMKKEISVTSVVGRSIEMIMNGEDVAEIG